jgi:hypothetical protein
VTDIADMAIKTKRRRAARLGQQDWWGVEMIVRAGPAQTAESGIKWARFSVCAIGWRILA